MESATENIPPKRFGAGKGEKVRYERTARVATRRGRVNPAWSKTK